MISVLTSKNRVARRGAKRGIGEKHGEKLPTGSGNPRKYNNCCWFFLQFEGVCMEALYNCEVLFYCFSNPTNGGEKINE